MLGQVTHPPLTPVSSSLKWRWLAPFSKALRTVKWSGCAVWRDMPGLRPSPSCSWRRQWHSTPLLLPRKFHGQRSLVGCSPWGRESDATERLHFHFSLSHNGEGNGNPLQCSCLENPGDGRAWWAAVYGVAQSRTRLKRLSSSSSSIMLQCSHPEKLHQQLGPWWLHLPQG